MRHWTRSLYQVPIPLGDDGRRVTGSQYHLQVARRAASEGAVLLKNEGNILPFARGTCVAPFGKGCADYVAGGGGSGEVTTDRVYNLIQGLSFAELQGEITYDHALADYYTEYVKRLYAKGMKPGLIPEAPFPSELAAKANTPGMVAVIVISRFSGEGWDRCCGSKLHSVLKNDILKQEEKIFPHGDFSLSDEERELVSQVTKQFSKVIVVLNVGGMVDTAWFSDNPHVQGALLVLQGGSMGGIAIADLLLGEENPSGRLVDTYARSLDDYPSTEGFHATSNSVAYTDDIFVGYRYFTTIPAQNKNVVYPFGYGLSYTTFGKKVLNAAFDGADISLTVQVTNTGKFRGKNVVEVYVTPPQGILRKAHVVLAAFGKTQTLAPDESVELTFRFPLARVASYDEKRAEWILEKGDYEIALGESCMDLQPIKLRVQLDDDAVVEQLKNHLVPSQLFQRLNADGTYEQCAVHAYEKDSCVLHRQSSSKLEGIVPEVVGQGYVDRTMESTWLSEGFQEVANGKQELESFIDSIDDDALIGMCGGQPNTGLANTYGFGNQKKYGIPNMMTCDGPAGVRILPDCGVTTTWFPCATLLASTWNEELLQEVGRVAASEVKENNFALWLAPAVNIHRSPLCGRNFEYYSEDPLLAGKLAASLIRGVQSNGVGACVKHFACNNKETNRKESDSIVSEQALREIYLRQFEIIIKESQPVAVMSSYNKINGIYAAENKELLTDILRGEWKFEGFVTSDWWNHAEHYLELKAGEDLKMGCGYPKRVKKALRKGAITMEDIKGNVRHLLQAMLRLD